VYYDYPTGTDTVPYSDNPGSLNTPDDTNVANFYKDDSDANGYDDGHAVTGSPGFPFPPFENGLTDVGAYTLSTSLYGTFDQGGNVSEWNEALISSIYRGIRGGGWTGFSNGLHASVRSFDRPTYEVFTGFRVASIPEPSTLLLAALAAFGLLPVCLRPRRLRMS